MTDFQQDIPPQKWGSAMWHSMHWIAAGFTDNASPEMKQSYKQWIESLVHVLPCATCCAHFKQVLDEHPVTDQVLESSISFRTYIVFLHNQINQILEKNKPLWTIEQVDKIYNNIIAPPIVKRKYVKPAHKPRPVQRQLPPLGFINPIITNRAIVSKNVAIPLKSVPTVKRKLVPIKLPKKGKSCGCAAKRGLFF